MQPTNEQLRAQEPIEYEGEKGYPLWGPQIGGYATAMLLIPAGTVEDCFDLLAWTDGEFPSEEPIRLHFCDVEQLLNFTQEVNVLLRQHATVDA